MNSKYILILLASLTVLSCNAQEDKQTPTEQLFVGVKDSKTTPEIISALIKAGAEINARDKDGATPLIIAARWNSSPEIFAALIKAGAEVNARDNDGNSPLMKAAIPANSHFVVCEALIKAGAEVNAGNNTGASPLMIAAWNNSNPAVCAALINAGAEVNASDNGGYSPLMLAVRQNFKAVCAVLIKAGADVNARDKDGVTPLMMMAVGSKNSHFICEALIKAGAEINARDNAGDSPLMWAVQHNSNPEVISALIKAGAEVYAINNDGRNAIDFAKEYKGLNYTNVYRQLNDASLSTIAEIHPKPQFEDFATTEYLSHPPIQPKKISSDDTNWQKRHWLEEPSFEPNFAGHIYAYVTGCGTNCKLLCFVDLRNGKLIDEMAICFSCGMSEDSPEIYKPIYRIDSRLLIVPCLVDNDGEGYHYMKYTDGNIVKLTTQLWDTQRNSQDNEIGDSSK